MEGIYWRGSSFPVDWLNEAGGGAVISILRRFSASVEVILDLGGRLGIGL